MSLRRSFPNAVYIPFNPAYKKKIDEAVAKSAKTIIVESNIPSIENVTREKWLVQNSLPPILEVGCQDGHLFRDQGFTDWGNWFGVDIDLWNIPNITQADIHKPPFKPKTFNTVVFAEIAEHVEDPETALVESLKLATQRLLISVPAEHLWGDVALPFMGLEEKTKLDQLTPRQQIDKNSRWLPLCLNPKNEIASWDEEKFEHLWHLRHFYIPEDVDKVPSGRTDKPEVNLFEYLSKASTRLYEESKREVYWHYEKFVYPPWAFHGVVFDLDPAFSFVTNYEFQHLFDGYEDYYTQTFTGEQQNLVCFMRRI